MFSRRKRLLKRTPARVNSGPTASAPGRAHFRRALRRNRAGIIALIAVGGLVALLTGISMAQGEWYPAVTGVNGTQGQPPPARFGAATTFDVAHGEVLVFGGFTGTAPGLDSNLCSLHSFASLACNVLGSAGQKPPPPPSPTDGKTYTFKSDTRKWFNRNPIHSPSPRGFASAAYDGARRNVVLFGGAPYRSSAVSGETWTWDGQDWTLQNPPEPVPDPRQNAVMVYDAHRKVVVMFGGRGADNKPLNDTWTWDGSAWKIMSSAGAPTARHSAAMAYDVCRAEAVMFGGLGFPIDQNTGRLFVPESGETWIWDGAKWRTPTKPPLLSPSRRVGASMAYSTTSGRVLLYGGLATTDTGDATVANDTDVWRWDEASATGWEKMNTEGGPAANATLASAGGDGYVRSVPPPRAYASFTHYPGGDFNAFTLYGGTPSADAADRHPQLDRVPQVALGDQFLFSDEGVVDTDAPGSGAGGVSTTPLTRRCTNPVPIPPDEAPAGGQTGLQVPKVEVREGVREFGRIPVLTGTDWPAGNRNTHISSSTPNPNYTPPPDCPSNGTGANAYLTTDPKRNRVYQFFICASDRGLDAQSRSIPPVYRLLITAYDGRTLKPLGSVLTPVRVENNFSRSGRPTTFLRDLLLHDAGRGRFLLRSQYQDSSTITDELIVIQQDLIEKSVDPVVKKIPLMAGLPPVSFFNHPKTGRAKLLISHYGNNPLGPSTFDNNNPLSTPPAIAQFDLESNTEDWRRVVDVCISTVYGGGLTKATRVEDRVYVTCRLSGSSRHAAVRIPVVEGTNGSETAGTVEAFAGPSNVVENWWDPQAERMLFLSDSLGGKVLWVFDGKASRYVGRVGISAAVQSGGLSSQYGLDHETGRFYVHMPDDAGSYGGEKFRDQGGLLVLDTRLTPVPQALKFPQFASPSGSPIASLPSVPGVPRRVFLRRAGGAMRKYPDGESVKMPNETFYTVLADEVPLPEKTELAQLDALTIPVAESPGKTEVSFDAEGSGYGIRLRSIGGIWSALRPPAQAYTGNAEVVESLVLGYRYVIPGCVFPDRELMAGWVPGARLSDLDAAARSSGLEVDSNSKVDLDGPFSRCNPSANASNLPPSAKTVVDLLWPLWQMAQSEANKAAGTGTVEAGKDADGTTTRTDTPLGTLDRGEDKDARPTAKLDTPASTGWDSYFKEVECIGDALATNTAAVGNIYGSAKCMQKQGMVEATARGSASGVGPASEAASSAGFSVGEGYSKVVVARDPVKGVVVTSTAVAKGIQLPGITIGYIETVAVAWSNGRPGEGRASFARKICRVQIPLFGEQQPYKDNACLTDSPNGGQQKELVDRWNSGWGINSKMILPTYDPELYKGSPGGYIAGVIKPATDEAEDQLFAKDFQREVAGLVIEFYKDSVTQGPGRQVLQLAATRAVAGLGVGCNSELTYSPSAKNCIALTFEDDLVEFDEEEELFADDAELDSADGFWEPVEASPPEPLALGKRIGRFISNLPVIRLLPIREVGEALLAFPVWLLLGLPLLLASRRFALNQAQRGD